MEYDQQSAPKQKSREYSPAANPSIIPVNEATSRRRTQEMLEVLLAMAEVLVSYNAEPGDGQGEPTMMEVTQQLANLTCMVPGWHSVTIVVVEPGTDKLQLVAAAGFSPEQEHHIRAKSQEITLHSSIGNPAFVSRLQQGETLIIDLTRPPYRDQRLSRDFHSALLVPMRQGTQLVGLITLNHAKMAHEYTPDEIALAGALSKFAMLAIEREQLLREREEARANELAIRAAKERMDEFLSLASHELRTPLTTVKGNIQLARLRMNSAMQDVPVENDILRSKLEEIKMMLERAEHQTNAENRLVGDLLDVTRIQANKFKMHLGTCDLEQIVREVVEEQRNVTAPQTIRAELADAETVPILADSERIRQVVANLLANALKYSPSDRPVEVYMHVEKQKARVLVHDEGPGLPPEELERIWERFYSAPGIERRRASRVGLGLGLYISRAIIEQHGGEVGIESAPGAGSTFWFMLPLAV